MPELVKSELVVQRKARSGVGVEEDPTALDRCRTRPMNVGSSALRGCSAGEAKAYPRVDEA